MWCFDVCVSFHSIQSHTHHPEYSFLCVCVECGNEDQICARDMLWDKVSPFTELHPSSPQTEQCVGGE